MKKKIKNLQKNKFYQINLTLIHVIFIYMKVLETILHINKGLVVAILNMCILQMIDFN